MKTNHISNNIPALQDSNNIATKRTSTHEKRNNTDEVRNENYPIRGNKQVNKENVAETVFKLNDFIDPDRTNLKFVFHEDLHEYYVTVVNHLTDEVIREIPPKKMLDMYAAMTEFLGLLVDEKV